MTRCKEFCDRLSDYLDGEIGKNECILIEEHLDVCAPCAGIFEALKTTLQLCKEGVSDDVPQEVQTRLKAFLRRHCQNQECGEERGEPEHGR